MKLRTVLVCLSALAGSIALTPVATAMPNGLPVEHGVSNVEQVRWVCNPWGRCWWRPNLYGAYGYYAPPPPPVYFGRPWRLHRPWHHRY